MGMETAPLKQCGTGRLKGHVHQGSWRDQADPCGAMKPLSKTGGNCSRSARETREVFKSYFCSEGQVSWQWKLVSRP
ncbi:uncharacterized protein LOC144132323 isoform X4 [Amblyomma americanum]